MPQLTSL